MLEERKNSLAFLRYDLVSCWFQRIISVKKRRKKRRFFLLNSHCQRVGELEMRGGGGGVERKRECVVRGAGEMRVGGGGGERAREMPQKQLCVATAKMKTI